jgi:ubiquitin C-terminal hydrolase
VFKLFYELYAVSEHSGSLVSGHYTAVARNISFGDEATEEGKVIGFRFLIDLSFQWYKFNDSYVTPLHESRLSQEIESPSSYLLFYRRIIQTEAPSTEAKDSSSKSDDQQEQFGCAEDCI